jgi:putative oxidoreductase
LDIIKKLISLPAAGIRGLDFLAPLVDLGARLWLANIFWKSGLTKIMSWDTTITLFTYEYSVPLLSPELAAALATSVEFCGAVMLAVGLGGRVGAAALFILNIVAVISYPDLSEVGLKDHLFWGILLALFLVHGPGKLSVDHWIRRRAMPPAAGNRHVPE